jgi:hypothetical protein
MVLQFTAAVVTEDKISGKTFLQKDSKKFLLLPSAAR